MGEFQSSGAISRADFKNLVSASVIGDLVVQSGATDTTQLGDVFTVASAIMALPGRASEASPHQRHRR
jgi:hypothetical protein